MSFQPVEYTVKSGDTLWAIGRAHGINWRFVARYNKETVPNPHQLRIGQTIKIPGNISEIVRLIGELTAWVVKHSWGALLEVAEEIMAFAQDPELTLDKLSTWAKNIGLAGIDLLMWEMHPVAGLLFTLGWFVYEYHKDISTYILGGSK